VDVVSAFRIPHSAISAIHESNRMHYHSSLGVRMSRLWLLRGDHDAPGWKVLRSDYEEEKVDIIHLDAHVWAMVQADDAPGGYEGLTATEPPDGLYIDPNGSPLYLANGEIVPSAREVVATLGEDAVKLLEQLGGDADRVLERLGRAF
jgi:hypothetical protein